MSFFESYLSLDEGEEREFQQEIKNLVPEEATRIMEMTTSWHKKGRQEGKEQGRQEGREEGKEEGRIREGIDLICKFLQTRFGSESTGLQDQVKEIDDLDSLNQLSDEIFMVQTMDEANKAIRRVLE